MDNVRPLSSRWVRAIIVLGGFAGALMSLATIAGLYGGSGGFLWVVLHGAAGPFAVVAMHHGDYHWANVSSALLLLGCAAGFLGSRSGWVLLLSTFSAIVWVFIGLSVGV